MEVEIPQIQTGVIPERTGDSEADDKYKKLHEL
jgi:hypothetical protein